MRFFARHHILDVLARARFNKRETARLLGISLASVYRKLSLGPPDQPDRKDEKDLEA